MIFNKLTSALRKALATAALAATFAGAANLIAPAQAAVIFDNLATIDANAPVNETRPAASAIVAQIQVGASDVNINQFGVWGSQLASGNVKFMIFNESGFTPVYISDAIATNAAARMWFDSPIFSPITLLANNNYYFGLISDQQFTFHWSIDNPVFTQNGLTSNAGGIEGDNGNVYSYVTPFMNDNCCIVTNATRIYGAAAVPEPDTLAIFGLGFLGLAITRRRKKA